MLIKRLKSNGELYGLLETDHVKVFGIDDSPDEEYPYSVNAEIGSVEVFVRTFKTRELAEKYLDRLQRWVNGGPYMEYTRGEMI
jgi:hypothetical protein